MLSVLLALRDPNKLHQVSKEYQQLLKAFETKDESDFVTSNPLEGYLEAANFSFSTPKKAITAKPQTEECCLHTK